MTAVAGGLKVPVGFRFRPTELELVNHYLQNKIQGEDSQDNLIIGDIDILHYEPWELRAKSLIKSDDDEWFFFSRPEYMPTKRNQIKRSTNRGFWKITGREHPIKAPGGRVVGHKRLLTFYLGRNRNSEKTDWVIHEYYIPANQRDIVLCRLIKKPDKKTWAAARDEGGPSNNASVVENEPQPAHVMDILMPPQESLEYFFERERERMLPSSHSNAVYNGTQSGFGDDEPVDEWVDSVIADPDQESCDELTHIAQFNDSTVSRPLRVVCADGAFGDTDAEAPSAQVKIGSGPSRRDIDVMLQERVHLQGGLLSDEGQSDSVNLFLADSSDKEDSPTFQINSVHVAFDEYYTNERGTTRYPLRSPGDAVKPRENPLPVSVTPKCKPAAEKPRPVLAFDEYYTTERGRRAGYPASSSRGAVKLIEKPKVPEGPKPPAVDLPKESITKVNKDKKVTQGEGSSFISWETIPLTSPPSIYFFNAVLGGIFFLVFARELVLYGNWC